MLDVRAKAAKAILKRLAAVEAAEQRDAQEADAVAELERRNSSLAAQLLALKQQAHVPLQGLTTQGQESPSGPLEKANGSDRRSIGFGVAGKAMNVSPQPLDPAWPMR